MPERPPARAAAGRRGRGRGTTLPAPVIAGVAVALAGLACAHYPPTAPLAAVQAPSARYTFDQLHAADIDDDIFVCLTFSGGGTRAASLAYGVLQKLRDTPIVRARDGRHESLLDEVDCISSVSGGSFTAAYYALFGPRIFTDFRHVFLEHDIEGDSAHRALNPLNWPRLMSGTFSRIDLAVELYDEKVFERRTFADLLKVNRRPFIILNSTELLTGDTFPFTQDQFDLIGSDLGAFPVARAVAASSAFPFLLTPVSLTNHPQPPGYVPPPQLALGALDYYRNRPLFDWTTHQAMYLDKTANPFVHVMDGGLADNIGLRSLEGMLWDPTSFLGSRFNRGKMSKLVFIVVNAKAGGPEAINRDPSPPGIAEVALKTATTAMDNYAAGIIQLLRDQQREARQAQQVVAKCKEVARQASDCPSFPAPTEIHVVDISLDAVADPKQRERLLNIGTNFSLSRADVQSLIDVAGELLDKNPDFQKLLKGLR